MAVNPLPIPTPTPTPDPERFAVEAYGVRKKFISREGLPLGWGFGDAHWIISSFIKYRQERRWKNALDGVDLTVARGELLGLLGPNGAGKTTFLRCLATLLALDEGAAFVNGYDVVSQQDEVKLSMNLVGSGQWSAFDWGLTVRQNLHFFGTLYGLDKAERTTRIDETLAWLDMAEHGNDKPPTLSAGERQRMLLAKAFMIRTPVFFLDEPTVGLDPDGAYQVRDFLMRQLIGSGAAGILTTHRMDEAEDLCARVAIMDRGRIVAIGTPLELKRAVGERSILEIRAERISRDVLPTLRALPGVIAAVVAPSGEEGLEESLRIHCEDLDRATGGVADTLAAGGVAIRSMATQEPSLEDVFISLTDKRIR
ncbi:MAG: ATP-binding cassette domain-containing protein [Actinopolymorphaceae bacterium]